MGSTTGIYKARQFDLSGLKGISDETLEMHFKLYEGYVKETNNLSERIQEFIADGKVDQEELPAYSELTRRLGFEYNGMVLHEYYFDNLTSGGGSATQRRRQNSRRLRSRRLAVTTFGKLTLLALEKCEVLAGPSVIRIRRMAVCRIIGSRFMRQETSPALHPFS